MTSASSRPVALSLQLYRKIAAAFPQEFKNAYGDELVLVAEDSIEDIWRRHGMPGLLRLLLDIAIRVPAEHLTELWHDTRYGMRMLGRSPGFTIVALISLGLGICVATGTYSDLNGTVFRNLPGVEKPHELVALQIPSSYPNYQRYSERGDLFSSTFAYIAPVPFSVSLGGHTDRTWGHLVTPGYFSTLGVRPAVGRFFDDEQQRAGQAATVVVSYRFWQNHLSADPAVIGKTLRMNGRPSTIVGVGPKDFQGASPMIYAADFWVPIGAGKDIAPELAGDALERRDLTIFQVIGRLKPGVTATRAEVELDAVARQIERAFNDPDRDRQGRRVLLVPGGRLLPIRSQDLKLMTAFPVVLVGLVLLIACSNVGNMMLARAAGRRKEIAVRLALGASRARLIRQLLTESALVAAGSGVLGFFLASWLMHLLTGMKLPYPMPVEFNVNPDGRVLLFTIALTALTGIAFGLAPALQATRADVTPALKEGGNIRLRGYRRFSLRNLLVLYQVSGSLMLLLLTGFLVRGFQRTSGIDVGFNAVNLYMVSMDPVRDGYSGDQAAAFFRKLSDRVNALPSVGNASLTETVPMAMAGNGSVTFSTVGSGIRELHNARAYVVGRNYFETVGIPIVRGRSFGKTDETGNTTAVIVSEKLVHDFWSRGDTIGRRIEIGGNEMAPIQLGSKSLELPTAAARKAHTILEVVGIAKDIKVEFAMEAALPAIYFPIRPEDYARPPMQGVTLLIRGVPGADAVGAVRREVSAIDPNLTLFGARNMRDQIDQTMFMVQMGMWIYGGIGIFGLILASIGLAGVTAYSVAQRTREIGIRMALGAKKSDIFRLVMKEGAALVAVGSVIGLAGAWAGTRALASLLSALATAVSASQFDPVLLIGAPLLLAALALLACYLPARRSMRIDPVVALRDQ